MILSKRLDSEFRIQVNKLNNKRLFEYDKLRVFLRCTPPSKNAPRAEHNAPHLGGGVQWYHYQRDFPTKKPLRAISAVFSACCRKQNSNHIGTILQRTT